MWLTKEAFFRLYAICGVDEAGGAVFATGCAGGSDTSRRADAWRRWRLEKAYRKEAWESVFTYNGECSCLFLRFRISWRNWWNQHSQRLIPCDEKSDWEAVGKSGFCFNRRKPFLRNRYSAQVHCRRRLKKSEHCGSVDNSKGHTWQAYVWICKKISRLRLWTNKGLSDRASYSLLKRTELRYLTGKRFWKRHIDYENKR